MQSEVPKVVAEHVYEHLTQTNDFKPDPSVPRKDFKIGETVYVRPTYIHEKKKKPEIGYYYGKISTCLTMYNQQYGYWYYSANGGAGEWFLPLEECIRTEKEAIALGKKKLKYDLELNSVSTMTFLDDVFPMIMLMSSFDRCSHDRFMKAFWECFGSKESCDTYNPSHEEWKIAVNTVITNYVRTHSTKPMDKINALVLDDTTTMYTTGCLLANGVENINCPNNCIDEDDADFLSTQFLEAYPINNRVNVVSATMNNFLDNESLTFYDFCYLDYCGFFQTYKNDIEILIKNHIAPNTACIIAFTFCYARSSYSIQDILDEFEDICKNNGKTYERVHLFPRTKNSMITGLYVVKNQ